MESEFESHRRENQAHMAYAYQLVSRLFTALDDLDEDGENSRLILETRKWLEAGKT